MLSRVRAKWRLFAEGRRLGVRGSAGGYGHRAVLRDSALLWSAVVLGLFTLAGLSLKQHYQIRQLTQLSCRRSLWESQNSQVLVNQLVSLQRGFDERIGREIARRQAGVVASGDTEELLRLEQSLCSLSEQVEQVGAQACESPADGSGRDVAARVADLTGQLDQAKREIKGLLGTYRGAEQALEELSGGVCLIQGEYIFVDPKDERPLRYVSDRESPFRANADAAVVGGDGEAREAFAASPAGKGRILLVQYSGTGFLIDGEGYIATNKHVTAPWEVSDEYQHVLEAGYKPQLCLFRAFFPGHAQPFDLRVAARSEAEDVALLEVDLGEALVPVLPCADDPGVVRVGQTVVVLGYPTGFDLLLARMSPRQLAGIVGVEGTSFEKVALAMSGRDLIQPVATRGMCGRVGSERIIYDAQTAIGASGAPVIGSEGKVVAINTALLKGFGGTNFGIPVREALGLLEKRTGRGRVARSSTGPSGM